MSIVIGLTGTTGAGKSSLSEIAKKYGFNVIDCDKVARLATEKGTDGLKALIKVFDEDILNSDGTLNRRRLALTAFSNSEKTELLNKTILPFIAHMIKDEIKKNNTLLDAPTLFESGVNKLCFKTVAVLADREIRLQRIIKRDNLTLNEANTRIGAGKSDDFFKENADYVIYNNGDEEVFKKHFSDILEQITGGNL